MGGNREDNAADMQTHQLCTCRAVDSRCGPLRTSSNTCAGVVSSSVHRVDCTLYVRQENGSTHLLIILCEALHSSTRADPAMREVTTLYELTYILATTCITALIIGMLCMCLMYLKHVS